MKVSVQLFAVARQLARQDEVVVELDDGGTINDVRQRMHANFPALNGILDHARWAVDAEFVSDDQPVTERSEIALIPPVSGG